MIHMLHIEEPEGFEGMTEEEYLAAVEGLEVDDLPVFTIRSEWVTDEEAARMLVEGSGCS